jgi:transcriptional regulator with XRE-family HTH domain
MALRIPSKLEVGQRLRWLRKQADLSGRALASLLGSNDPGLVPRMEQGHSLDHIRLLEIAAVLAGRGQLVKDERPLADFMLFGGEVATVLRPHLRPVGDGDGAFNDAQTGTQKKLSHHSDKALNVPTGLVA